MIVIASWLTLLYLIFWTVRSSVETQEAVARKMTRIVFFAGTIFWVSDPGRESDPEKRKIKEEKLKSAVRNMAWQFIISAILGFLIGLFWLPNDLLAFQFISLILAPIFGLYALYFVFLWHLLKEKEKRKLASADKSRS